MSPVDQQGNWYPPDQPRADASVASAARTTTGTGTAFDVDQAESLEASLDITAVAGTAPTLDLVLESTVDGTHWWTVGSFSQKTAQGTDAKVFGPLGQQARWKWTIGGTTPSFTFSVAVTADN